MTATNDDNEVGDQSLEKGLVQLSKTTFSTSRYLFQEGQELSADTVNDWLSRKSKDEPSGLNPVDNNKKEANTRNPIRLEEILEQDYLTRSGSSYKLGGISLGLAMNSADYFTKTPNGTQYHTNIPRDAQESYGKQVADEIVARLRKRRDLKNVPIMIGLFSKTDQDSLIGGTYFTYGTAEANSSKIKTWKKLNNRSQVLPLINNETAINSNDVAAFSDFKSAVENYFPDISGVVANVYYENGKLTQENISITTQFYGYTQIESFSRLVLSAAKKYLGDDAAIEIKISSVNDVQAVISKNSADDSYYVHVFGG